MTQPTLFNVTGEPTFDGATFNYAQDHTRLKSALDKVAMLMRDGKARTLSQIAEACGISESGASARLRDLRKPKFARYQVSAVDSVRHSGGLWLYTVHYF